MFSFSAHFAFTFLNSSSACVLSYWRGCGLSDRRCMLGYCAVWSLQLCRRAPLRRNQVFKRPPWRQLHGTGMSFKMVTGSRLRINAWGKMCGLFLSSTSTRPWSCTNEPWSPFQYFPSIHLHTVARAQLQLQKGSLLGSYRDGVWLERTQLPGPAGLVLHSPVQPEKGSKPARGLSACCADGMRRIILLFKTQHPHHWSVPRPSTPTTALFKAYHPSIELTSLWRSRGPHRRGAGAALVWPPDYCIPRY